MNVTHDNGVEMAFHKTGLIQLLIVTVTFILPFVPLTAAIYWLYVALGLVQKGVTANTTLHRPSTTNSTNGTNYSDPVDYLYVIGGSISIVAILGVYIYLTGRRSRLDL